MLNQRRPLLFFVLAVVLANWLPAVGATAPERSVPAKKVMAGVKLPNLPPPKAAVKSSAALAPLVVENPFAKSRTTPVQTPPTEKALPPPLAGGAVVDAEAPSVYRLPLVEGRDLRVAMRPMDVATSVAATTVPSSATISPTIATPVVDSMTVAVDAVADSSAPPSEQLLQEMNGLWTESFAVRQSSFAFDPAAAIPYTPTAAEISRQLLPSIRKAYGLAQRGATFAAQAEFIQLLRRLAQAKDAEQGTDAHSRALAAGLRALDEAEDFMPDGVQLEAEMDVAVVRSSHRTPILQGQAEAVLPHEAIAVYHQYAEVHLARAVAGEPAGSMVLYGLGKVHSRLTLNADGDLKHERKAMAMFLAALAAGPDNHLAANEVGVLLARGGHPAEAAAMFRRAIDANSSSTSYHNLAVVEHQLGQHAQAVANEQYAEQLAARDRAIGAVSRQNGIAWVAPDELARVTPTQPMPPDALTGQFAGQTEQVNAPTAHPAPTESAWKKVIPGFLRR
jgi:tetratricopeptide (TPR) repeat protein